MSSSQPSEKKRKRHYEKDDRPKKKKHRESVNGESSQSQAQPPTVAVNGNTEEERPPNTIKLIHVPHDDDATPIIATTPGITLPPSLTFTAYRKTNTKSPETILHSSTHPRIDYTAREAQDGALTSYLKHYIAIYDDERKEMQLIEATRMSIRSTLRSEDAEVKAQKVAKQESGGLTQRQQLASEFGTKKAKKAIAALTENAVSTSQVPAGASQQEIQDAVKENPAASAVLDSMETGAGAAPSREELQRVVDEAKPRPKANLQAKSVEEVYDIGSSDVMGEEMLRLVKVKPWFDAVEAGEDVRSPCRFVVHRLKEIVDRQEEEGSDAVRKVKVLRYLAVLVQFYKGLIGGKGKVKTRKVPKTEVLVKSCDVDGTVVESVKKKFANGQELTKWHVDNLLTHIAVLSLYIDDYATDTFDIREDLGLTQKEVDQYFKEIGARMAPMNDDQRKMAKMSKEQASLHKIARLKLPLEFPKQRIMPMKKR